MKISKSKKELARIISENGGWRDGNYAVQDKDDKKVWFMRALAGRPDGASFWPGVKSRGIPYSKVLTNWHQTILTREEYFHLYPAPDADGWIGWKGEPKSPVANGVMVDVRLKGGAYHEAELLDDASWSGAWGDESIIAYRLHKPEQENPESCDPVTRSVPEIEAKPTIEQLAADYRNLKDFADRKQQEADAARDEAGAKLKALELAGEAIGLLVSPITTKQETELVIADWRDLRVDDIIEYVDGCIEDKTGMTGPVVEFAPDATDGMMVRMECDNGPNKGRLGWPMKWRFIRRP